MNFDLTLSLSALLHLIGMVTAGVVFVVKIRQDLQKIESRINERLRELEVKVDMIYEWWTEHLNRR